MMSFEILKHSEYSLGVYIHPSKFNFSSVCPFNKLDQGLNLCQSWIVLLWYPGCETEVSNHSRQLGLLLDQDVLRGQVPR